MKLRLLSGFLVVVIVALAGLLLVKEQESQKLLRASQDNVAKLERQIELLRQEALSKEFVQQEKAAKAAAPKGGPKLESR